MTKGKRYRVRFRNPYSHEEMWMVAEFIGADTSCSEYDFTLGDEYAPDNKVSTRMGLTDAWEMTNAAIFPPEPLPERPPIPELERVQRYRPS